MTFDVVRIQLRDDNGMVWFDFHDDLLTLLRHHVGPATADTPL
jgi:hypothetical protein